jgi:hypothetical protein
VQLEDKRVERGLAFEIDLNIEHVQNNPLTNVAEMSLKK